MPNTPEEAFQRLVSGNARSLSGKGGIHQDLAARRSETASGQHPFAIILGCADSRVSPQITFDQGIGDLFTVRVAGNIAAPSQLGSIEFAAEEFGSPLVVVLGHEGCGALNAALKVGASGSGSENIDDILGRIHPALSEVPGEDEAEWDARLQAAIRANVLHTVSVLEKSSILARRIDAGQLRIQGAEYSLQSGEVTFLEQQTG